MCKINKISKLVLLLSAFIAGGQAWAQSWYQVEVIVFDYTRPDLDGELWFENPGLPLRDNAIDMLKAAPDPMQGVPYGINQPAPDQDDTTDTENTQPNLVPYLALPEANYRLSEDYRRLRLSSAYRPLLHAAWEQPGLGSAEVRQVHLERITGDTITQPVATAVAEGDETAGKNYIPPDPIFDGLIRLRSSSDLLYVDVDIAYFPADFRNLLTSQSGDAASLNDKRVNLNADYVRLTDSRRIRLNELNFFDHPLFGVLLQVSRIDSG